MRRGPRSARSIRPCGARSSRRCASIWGATAATCRRRCWRSSRRPSSDSAEARRPKRRAAGASDLLAVEANGLRRALLRKAPEADHPLSLDLQAVAPHEGFLAVGCLHERAVGALVDQHELVAADLDARVQARDQVALDHDIVVLGTADGD